MDDDRRGQLTGMITPLRLIFWGGLLCLIDITFSQKVNGSGFKFDLLDDFLGMLLITTGVFRLSRFTASRNYDKGMAYVKVVAVLSTFKALLDHWVFPTPHVWDLFWTFFSIAELAAIVLFCSLMHLLCRVHQLDWPARSWKTTTMTFVIVYAIPLGLFYSASLIAMMTGKSFHVNLGPWALLLIPGFAVPRLDLAHGPRGRPLLMRDLHRSCKQDFGHDAVSNRQGMEDPLSLAIAGRKA